MATYTSIRKMRVETADCEYFKTTDVRSPLGKLAKGDYVITQYGAQTEQTIDDVTNNYTWYAFLKNGEEYFAVHRSGVSWLFSPPAGFADERTPTAMVTQAQSRAAAAQNELAALDGRIATAQSGIAAAENTIREEAQLYEKINAFVQQLQGRISQHKAEVEGIANGLRQEVTGKTAALQAEAEVQQAALLKRLNRVRNPVKGDAVPIADILESLFGLHCGQGLTAGEYEALQLTALGYLQHQLSAFEYATGAKVVLG